MATLTETDHAAEATALLNAFTGDPEDLPNAELIAYAQVHATLAVAQHIERQTDAIEAQTGVLENLEHAVCLLADSGKKRRIGRRRRAN